MNEIINKYLEERIKEKFEIFKKVLCDTFCSLSNTTEYPFILTFFKDDKDVKPDDISSSKLSFLCFLAEEVVKDINKLKTEKLEFFILKNYLKSFLREFRDFNILQKNFTFLLNSLKFSLYFTFSSKSDLEYKLEEIYFNYFSLLNENLFIDASYLNFILEEIGGLKLMLLEFIKISKNLKKREKNLIKSLYRLLKLIENKIHNKKANNFYFAKEDRDEYIYRLLKETFYIYDKPKEILEMIEEIFLENLALYEKLKENAQKANKKYNRSLSFYKIKELIFKELFALHKEFKELFPLKYGFKFKKIKILKTPSYFSNFWPLAAYFRNTVYIHPDNLKKFGNIESLLKLITIHEIYPGHLYQELFAKNSNSSIFKHLNIFTFSEGWALYLEDLLLKTFKLTEEERLTFIKFKLIRCLRAIYDMKINLRNFLDSKRFHNKIENIILMSKENNLTNDNYLSYLKEKVAVNPLYYLSYVYGFAKFVEYQSKFKKKLNYSIIKNGDIPFWIFKK
jgi:hypothetical protein